MYDLIYLRFTACAYRRNRYPLMRRQRWQLRQRRRGVTRGSVLPGRWTCRRRGPVATELQIGFVPVRKPGKLPRASISEEYALEYGTNTLSIHADALKKGDKVIIVDDLLATGGTALAGAHLCERLGAEVVGMAFVIDLKDLNGKKLLKDYDVFSLLEYEGE